MRLLLGLTVGLCALACVRPASATEPVPVLSLHQAITDALINSPSLARSISRAGSMAAATSGAAVPPNPELAVEAENIGGDGPYEGLNGAELTYAVSQRVEMPGKRSGRTGLAQGEAMRSIYERDAARLDLIRDVVIAYASVVAAKEKAANAREENGLSKQVYDSVAAKVEAGKEPPVRRKKASIDLTASGIALGRAERAVQTAEKTLSILTGGTDAFAVSKETLPRLKRPENFSVYMAMLDRSPDVHAYEAGISAAQSALSLEKARAMPDPVVSVGVRDLREEDRQAFVAGLSIPLPVFDLNRAGIRQAGHDYNTAMLDRTQARLNAEDALIRAYEGLANAYAEHEALSNEILPATKDAFDVAQEGYRAGKFGYLDVLDAKRALFTARDETREAWLSYYRSLAIIDRLTAAHALSKGDMK